jgi:hypothetical protein
VFTTVNVGVAESNARLSRCSRARRRREVLRSRGFRVEQRNSTVMDLGSAMMTSDGRLIVLPDENSNR